MTDRTLHRGATPGAWRPDRESTGRGGPDPARRRPDPPEVSPGSETGAVPGVRVHRSAGGLLAFVVDPPGLRTGPAVVAIHGVHRGAHSQLRWWAPVCRAAGRRLVVPFFGPTHRGFQRLRRVGGARSDERLWGLCNELGENAPVDLFGWSAGAQLAHRAAMVTPSRVRRLVVAAAGWWTFPDPEVDWPLGWRGIPAGWDCLGPRAFLRIPTLVVVGTADTGRDPNLRADPVIDLRQGLSRLERARRFSRALRAAGGEVTLVELEGVSHDFEAAAAGGLIDVAAHHLGLDAPGSSPTPAHG